jgi:hypothetical protein
MTGHWIPGIRAAVLLLDNDGRVCRVRFCQSLEHLAEVVINPEVALAVTQDEPCAGQILRQPLSVCGRCEAVFAAIPQQNRAANRTEIDVLFPDPGNFVPAAAGSLAQCLAHCPRK